MDNGRLALTQKILRLEKFSDGEILESSEVTAFFNMSNRIALATDMRPNDEYHKMNR